MTKDIIIYIGIYIVLCIISIFCSIRGFKKNSNGYLKAYLILSFIAGFVLALGLSSPDQSSSTIYISGPRGMGGMKFNSFIMVILCSLPPYIIGLILGLKNEKKK